MLSPRMYYNQDGRVSHASRHQPQNVQKTFVIHVRYTEVNDSIYVYNFCFPGTSFSSLINEPLCANIRANDRS